MANMVVEKKWIVGQLPEQNRIQICLMIKAKGSGDFRRLELGTFREGSISVNVLDSAYNVIHQEQNLQSANQNSLTISLSDLPPDQYFVEVDDGFFIQVKEVELQ